jgi:lipopolysaccharide export system permease protein
MRIVDRYIGRTIGQGVAFVLAVLLVLVVLMTFIDELDDVGRGQYRVMDAFVYVLFSVPRYVFEAFPVAALLGSLIGLGVLANHGELTAMRAAGVSIRQIVTAVLKAGVLMMAVVIVLGELVAPPMEQYAKQVRAERQHQQVILKSRYGFWARDGRAFVNIRRLLSGSALGDIYIYEFNDARRLELMTHAAYAHYKDDHWVLRDLKQTRVTESGVESRSLEKANWDSLLDPSLLRAVVVQPTMLPAWGLYQYISFMKENGQQVPAYEVAFWAKVVAPFATLVMLFLAVPFVFGSLRAVGIGQRIFVGALAGSVFFLLNRALSYVAVVYELNPVVAAALPAAAFLLVGTLLLRRIR